MALVRRGSRRIVVDGATYRWRIRRKPTYCQDMGWGPLTYAVELGTGNGTVLVVETGRAHLGNSLLIPSEPVLPAEVADSIRTARARGWTPDATGTPFVLKLANYKGTP